MGKKIFILLVVVLSVASFFLYQHQLDQKKLSDREKVLAVQSKYPVDHLIILLGDSMTEALGNSFEIREYLFKAYPEKTLDIYNYGFGSTNILSVPERLTSWTKYGRDFQPILDIDFDLILIESFGFNPLSEYTLEDGLKKQTETLDKIVSLIKEKRPTVKIVFVATISPNSQKYGVGLVHLSPEERKQWTKERVAYIKNHIEYARSRHIPLINIFEKSLDELGDGNLKYIESQTYIHPSPEGIIFISQEIADFIYQNNLLTN